LDERSEMEGMTRREQILNDNYFTYKTIPLSKTFKKFFRRIDFYAKPITLKHKGEYKFYTNLGAYTSFAIILIMIGFSTYLFVNMISGYNFSVDHKIFSYTQEDYPEINFASSSFDVAFALFDEQGEIFDDQTYFKFIAFSKVVNKKNKVPEEIQLPIDKCSKTGNFGDEYGNYF